jgi:hypothetical protein
MDADARHGEPRLSHMKEIEMIVCFCVRALSHLFDSSHTSQLAQSSVFHFETRQAIDDPRTDQAHQVLTAAQPKLFKQNSKKEV